MRTRWKEGRAEKGSPESSRLERMRCLRGPAIHIELEEEHGKMSTLLGAGRFGEGCQRDDGSHTDYYSHSPYAVAKKEQVEWMRCNTVDGPTCHSVCLDLVAFFPSHGSTMDLLAGSRLPAMDDGRWDGQQGVGRPAEGKHIGRSLR